MKNILKTTIFAFLLLAIGSCTTDTKVVAVAKGLVLHPMTPAGPYVLSPVNGDVDVVTLTWDMADNGVASIPSTYVVEIAKSGTSFANPITASPSSPAITYIWKEGYLNSILLANGFLPDAPADIDIRIKSTFGLGFYPLIQYSNVLSAKVTPFAQSALAFTKVGDDPANAPKMISSGLFTTDCEGYAYLVPGSYKFYTSVQNTYQGTNPYYGDNGSGAIVLNGSAINITTAGFYMIKADIGTKMTYSVTPSEWGIFGLAKPFPSSANKKMIFDVASNKWTLTIVLAGGKAIKFRNTASTLILGGFDATKVGVDFAGTTMSYNGKDILLPGTTAATYLVTLDLSSPRNYSYTLVKQ